MPERPYTRYTREKTWQALYSQAINACYAIVPYSATNNSVWLVRCSSPAETQSTMASLLSEQRPERAGEAVVLAKSSDYWRYHLEDRTSIDLVVAGIHDSYLHLPVWEMRTNQRYKARETALTIGSPEFEQARRTQQAHTTLVSALAAGDKTALAYIATLPERTRRRIRQEAGELQADRYQGRPLAFHTESERQAIGQKISAGLLLYHAKKRTG